MSIRLQDYIKPLNFCDRGEHLKGTIPLTGMSRLTDALCDQNGEVEIDFAFDVDASGNKTLRGHLKATLALECQRCMKAVATLIETDISLAFVDTEAAGKQLPSEYDPYILDEATVVVRELVEDELILALPIVTFHPEDECAVAVLQPREEIETPQPVEKKKPKPFGALAGLKKVKSDDE
ncbi:MAG: DUF177 domain-containing protein [Thiotrichaceae bacterium]|nr:DUF177 domain-containing protein [Thiotrichaceae bacterium]PCI15032.1 MAG: hypothetical protein COB71_00375 [Thiotrichales bacterium]